MENCVAFRRADPTDSSLLSCSMQHEAWAELFIHTIGLCAFSRLSSIFQFSGDGSHGHPPPRSPDCCGCAARKPRHRRRRSCHVVTPSGSFAAFHKALKYGWRLSRSRPRLGTLQFPPDSKRARIRAQKGARMRWSVTTRDHFRPKIRQTNAPGPANHLTGNSRRR